MNQLSIFAVILLSMLSTSSPAEAAYGRSRQITANTISTATVQAPRGLAATAGCEAGAPEVTLTWVMTTSTFADGYDLYVAASAGGPYSLIGHVSERETLSATDRAVAVNTTYHYVARATAFDWLSVNSTDASATTALC